MEENDKLYIQYIEKPGLRFCEEIDEKYSEDEFKPFKILIPLVINQVSVLMKFWVDNYLEDLILFERKLNQSACYYLMKTISFDLWKISIFIYRNSKNKLTDEEFYYLKYLETEPVIDNDFNLDSILYTRFSNFLITPFDDEERPDKNEQSYPGFWHFFFKDYSNILRLILTKQVDLRIEEILENQKDYELDLLSPIEMALVFDSCKNSELKVKDFLKQYLRIIDSFYIKNIKTDKSNINFLDIRISEPLNLFFKYCSKNLLKEPVIYLEVPKELQQLAYIESDIIADNPDIDKNKLNEIITDRTILAQKNGIKEYNDSKKMKYARNRITYR